MNKVEKVQAISELFQLINMYYEERDQPTGETDFFIKVENLCYALDLDAAEFKKVFGIGGIL